MKEETIGPTTARDYRTRVCRAMNFISRNLDRPLALEEVAGAASFSVHYFHRIFKAVVGETVAEFTRRLRLEQAANHLILSEDRDVITIAIGCGFSSSQNLATAFRQQFGLTPSAYRTSKMPNKMGAYGKETCGQGFGELGQWGGAPGLFCERHPTRGLLGQSGSDSARQVSG